MRRRPVPAPRLQPQNISNFLWACAKLGYRNHDLMADGVCAAGRQRADWREAAALRLPACPPPLPLLPPRRPLLATHPVPRPPHSLRAAARHGARVMHVFTPQSIANMIWAYATLDEWPDRAFLQARAGGGMVRLGQRDQRGGHAGAAHR